MIRFSMITDQGSRENNEDSIGMYQEDKDYCFILADGLGGHGKGEVASKLAVEAVIRQFVGETAGEEFLEQAFQKAQEDILETQKEAPGCFDMKTTLVVLEIRKDQIRWGHIGDSRLYCFENGKYVKRTLDHSVPQMLVAIGEIREKDIRHHTDRNRLLRVLGVEDDEVNPSIGDWTEVRPGQAFLLCSDGFWELIEEKKMEKTLKKADTPEEWLKLMEEIVLKNGKGTNMDNYSAIGVWID